ncbi:MAG: XdhC family protein [Thermoanaerobaculales bacterium]|jgi:xanthine dehydrogenase accessory factor|nr:XdhC family protein [Thermoanaerobaculales bacterium]
MKAQPDTRIDPWRYALDAVDEGKPTTLVMVVEHSGSVPGVTGTFVVVTADGQSGTVGGGVAEHEIVEEARAHQAPPVLREFVHTEDGDGTLCNGAQLFSVVPLGRSDRDTLQEIVETLRNGRIGALELGPHGMGFSEGSEGEPRFSRHDNDWRFTHPIGLRDRLTIVGGGHVALALSRIMATLPFRITVIDNRDGLETMEENHFAHRFEVVDYDEIDAHIPQGEHSWVVVMTHGHTHDREVTERLLDLDLRYLGLMGSKSKVRTFFSRMTESGCDPAALARLRTPIGVPIGSHTPEEIAVSIAAEIIGIRNGALD